MRHVSCCIVAHPHMRTGQSRACSTRAVSSGTTASCMHHACKQLRSSSERAHAGPAVARVRGHARATGRRNGSALCAALAACSGHSCPPRPRPGLAEQTYSTSPQIIQEWRYAFVVVVRPCSSSSLAWHGVPFHPSTVSPCAPAAGNSGEVAR